jgi:hypothetical protein
MPPDQDRERSLVPPDGEGFEQCAIVARIAGRGDDLPDMAQDGAGECVDHNRASRRGVSILYVPADALPLRAIFAARSVSEGEEIPR